MKILFYTTDLKFGGAQRVISILANAFAQRGHDVKIFIYNEYDTVAYELHKNVSVAHLNSKFRITNPIRTVRELYKTRKQIAAFSPDIIISFYAIDTVLVKLSCICRPVPIIYSQRCDPYSTTLKEHLYEKFAVKFAEHIIFQSSRAQQYYPKPTAEKSDIIFNPIQTDLLPMKQHLPNSRNIIAVGRLTEQKNHTLLIKAFDEIKTDFPDCNLMIFGDGPLKKDIQSLIRGMNLQDRVFLMGNHADVTQYMAKASLFVLTSLYEGQPNALLEAMCVGLPCISTDWSPKGTVTDLIKDGENGRIVFSMNANDMADAIRQLLADQKLADTLGKNARLTATKVNADNICEQWLKVIFNITKEKQQR